MEKIPVLLTRIGIYRNGFGVEPSCIYFSFSILKSSVYTALRIPRF